MLYYSQSYCYAHLTTGQYPLFSNGSAYFVLDLGSTLFLVWVSPSGGECRTNVLKRQGEPLCRVALVLFSMNALSFAVSQRRRGYDITAVEGQQSGLPTAACRRYKEQSYTPPFAADHPKSPHYRARPACTRPAPVYIRYSRQPS